MGRGISDPYNLRCFSFPTNLQGKTFDQVIIPRRIEISKASSTYGAIQVVRVPEIASAPAGFIATSLGKDIIIIYTDNPKNLAQSVDDKVKVSNWAGDLELGEALVNKERHLEYRKLISETDKRRATYYLG
jgi:hypothetical protein